MRSSPDQIVREEIGGGKEGGGEEYGKTRRFSPSEKARTRLSVQGVNDLEYHL